jgi:hypothetical protein
MLTMICVACMLTINATGSIPRLVWRSAPGSNGQVQNNLNTAAHCHTIAFSAILLSSAEHGEGMRLLKCGFVIALVFGVCGFAKAQHSASLPCGMVNPHLTYSITSDTGAVRTGGVNQFDNLVATTLLHQHVDDNFASNGRGSASGTVETLCTLVQSGEARSVYTRLDLTTTVMGQSGACCSGFGPGGTASAQVEWQTTLDLPAGDKGRSWSFSVALDTKSSSPDWQGYPVPTGKCTLAIDGIVAGHELDISLLVATFTELLDNGPHALDLQCPQLKISNQGAGSVFAHTVTINQSLYLKAVQADDSAKLK